MKPNDLPDYNHRRREIAIVILVLQLENAFKDYRLTYIYDWIYGV